MRRGNYLAKFFYANARLDEKVEFHLPQKIIGDERASKQGLIVSDVSFTGQIDENMENSWVKVFATEGATEPMHTVSWPSGTLVTKITDIVRAIKEDTKDTLNAIMLNSSIIELVPSETVKSFEVSPALAAQLGIPAGVHKSRVCGSFDLFVHYRQCVLQCYQLEQNFSILADRLSVATPLNLDISSNGSILSARMLSPFNQSFNFLKTMRSYNHLSFSIVSMANPSNTLRLKCACLKILIQIISA